MSDDHLQSFENIKKFLLKATTTALRQAMPGQQYLILCDASYYSNGFVLMIEDNLKHKDGKKKQSSAPKSFGSQHFNTSQLKISTYCMDFFALGCFGMFLNVDNLLFLMLFIQHNFNQLHTTGVKKKAWRYRLTLLFLKVTFLATHKHFLRTAFLPTWQCQLGLWRNSIVLSQDCLSYKKINSN